MSEIRSYSLRLAVDILLLAGAAMASYAIRRLLPLPGHPLEVFRAYLPFLGILVVSWLVFLHLNGLDGGIDAQDRRAFIRAAVRVNYHFLLAVALVSFILRLTATNRVIFLCFAVLSNLLLWITRRYRPSVPARRPAPGDHLGTWSRLFKPLERAYRSRNPGSSETSRSVPALPIEQQAVPFASVDDMTSSMLRARSLGWSLTLLAADALAVVAAFAAAYFLRRRLHFGHAPSGLLRQHLPLLAAALPMLAASFFHFHLHDYSPLRPFREELSRLARALFWGWMVLIVLIFCLRYELTNRLFLGAFFFLCCGFVIGGRWGLRKLMGRGRPETERAFHNVVVAGNGGPAREVAAALERHQPSGLRLLGYVVEQQPSAALPGAPVLGTLENFAQAMSSAAADSVVFILAPHAGEEVERALSYCFQVGIQPWICAPGAGEPAGLVRVEKGFFTFPATPQTDLQRILKRGFDLVAALASLAFFAPVMLLTTLLIRLESEGPAVFRQERVGLSGRRFTLYKFRTMLVEAERMKEQLSPRNELDGPVFKMRDDPRVTRVGRFLRRASLDELPQLINVLLGHMSIVGPRPPLPQEVEKYELWQRRRLSMKPGLTCLWQVSGRNRLDFRTWMEMDLRYIDHWSWRMDLKILLRTVPAMFQGQ